jgi:teichuronic acid biosynthesis glycosyltransferase TuaC
MRLLFLSVVYPNPLEPTKGTFNQSFVEALAADHEVQVVAPLLWTVRWRLERWARNAVETPSRGVPVRIAHPVFYYTPKILRSWHGHFLWLSIRRTLEPILASFRPEAVVGYWAHPDGAVAVRAARKAGALAGLIVGGSDLLLLTRDPRRRRAILDVLHAVDAVFTVGSDLRKRALELGVPPDKVHDFRQGVDTHRFFPGDPGEARERLSLAAPGPILVWVGRMIPVKGLEVLLEACRLLHRERPGFRLVLVGDGPLRPKLEAEVAAQGLVGTVLFAGAVAHHGLPDWYRAADLTVMSSWSEGIPNVLLESLACGTPFVATAVGSIPELAIDPGQDIVRPGDAGALARAIAHRLGHPVERRAMVQYRWSDTAATVVSALTSLRRDGA